MLKYDDKIQTQEKDTNYSRRNCATQSQDVI